MSSIGIHPVVKTTGFLLNSFIKRFVANALWSEYSAQFDDANYPIDEDTFIKTAKTFVKPQLIRDIEDYDFA